MGTQPPPGTGESPVELAFAAAMAADSPEERARRLDQACGGDAELRARVVRLLDAQPRVGSFLQSPASDLLHAFDRPALPLREGPGSTIGPYKLLEQVGEGGMGVVFLAEQTRPVRRQVALKVIKAGMDTRQVVARFEAERQALALMDHPNIAKVLDAGATDSGRPYFVMELVKGVPITRYCDEHRLTPEDRLGLFLQVCHAVQHAHTKGVIHRDLKPSNVLVASYDGRPVPKVIDFGVAKATGGRLTDHSLITGLGTVVGTPEYMSPEQAELNQLDVDTRSDVYSLGVILYELLTGSTPLERDRLKKAALMELLRVVREEEPPRPSTRLSTSDRLPSIAASRGLEPGKLSGVVRGELEPRRPAGTTGLHAQRADAAGVRPRHALPHALRGGVPRRRPPLHLQRLHRHRPRHRARGGGGRVPPSGRGTRRFAVRRLGPRGRRRGHGRRRGRGGGLELTRPTPSSHWGRGRRDPPPATATAMKVNNSPRTKGTGMRSNPIPKHKSSRPARTAAANAGGGDRGRAPRRAAVEALEGRRMFSSYTATILETPADSFSSRAHDINASGQVVGTAWIGQFDGWNPQGDRALLWDDGVMIDLGSLGGRHSSAQAINDLGQVVGWTTRPDNSGRGFLINPEDTDRNGAPDRWSRDANGDGANDLMVELPMPGASDINNTGQVIDRDSIWTPVTPNGTTGTRVDLGFQAGASPYRGARAINDAGQVVGAALIEDVRHAVLWQGGVMTSLGEGIALAINASGQIAGYLDNNPSYGFLWSPTRPNGTVGTITVVPGLFGGTVGAYAITAALDSAGRIVGGSGIVTSGDDGGGGAEQRAMLWADGVPQDLNALIDPAPNGAWLEHAAAMNDAGQIVGHTAGPFLGTPHREAVLLTPINDLPKVRQVYVSGSAWSDSFKQFLADRGTGSSRYGFAVPAGDQLNELPWIGLDQVSITFSGGVRVDQDDLRVTGVNVPAYAVSGFAYDAGTNTATWTLGRSLVNDRVVLELNGDAGGVSDPQGRLLDGEWTAGPASAFPSGDGSPGGDFRFALNVLPGDTTSDGVVLARDFAEVKKKFFKNTTSPVTGTDADYSPFHDIDGSGVILARDFAEVKKRFFNALPAPQPAAAAALFGSTRVPDRATRGLTRPPRRSLLEETLPNVLA